MISNSNQSDRDPVILRLSPEQFEVLFQVTKEFRSLPDLRLAAIGVTSDDVDRLLEFVRSIRRRIEGASQIQLHVDLDKTDAPPPPDAPAGSAESQASAPIHGAVTGRLLASWERLLDAAIVSLGPRELFLRTGYDEPEIRQVTVQLARRRPPTAESGVRDGDMTAE